MDIDLKSASQFGGAYVQVVAYQEWIVASRVGGLQVFSDLGALHCLSECALIDIPLLKIFNGKLYAVFKTCVQRVCVDFAGNISLEQDSHVDLKYEKPRGHDYQIDFSGGRFVLDREHASVSTPTGEIKLPGYSRPSGMALSSDLQRLYVADMGIIHQLLCDGGLWRITDGFYESTGWPKDVACEHGNVFVANVLGVSWYQETNEYPYLRLQDRICKFHFRIAKVEVRNSLVYACDEARGLHVFEARNGKLKPIGGLFVEGGGWDFLLKEDGGFLASGAGGWHWFENLNNAMRMMPSVKVHRDAGTDERIQGIACWSRAEAVVIMSSMRVLILDASLSKELYSLECNAWSGIAADDLFVVASPSGLFVFSFDGMVHFAERVETTEARDVAWDGHYLWVADGKGGVKCFSIGEDRKSLIYCGCFPVCGFCRGICRTATRIYIGAGDGGLVVIKSSEV